MIPFQTWLSQIIRYSYFISNEIGVRRAWVNGDYSQTSVTDFDELYEQIFDDLDSDLLEQNIYIKFIDDLYSQKVLQSFLDEMRLVDATRNRDDEMKVAMNLINSDEWKRLVKAANEVASHFGAQGT